MASVDTIVLRIHNLKQYESTINNLINAQKTGSTQVFEKASETGEFKDNFTRTEILKMVYSDTGAALPLNHRNSVNIASSHYTLSYLVSRQKDYVEFNFSIPKFIWGTNLFQHVDYYDTSCDTTFTKLMLFIRGFLKSPFFLDTILLDDIEINRVDLCYNQFFASQFDALKYLDAQVKKFGRTMVVRANESVMIVKDRYSFKIYHKGAEFINNDLPKLMAGYGKRGKQGLGDRRAGNPNGYDLQALTDIANKILRYEITFRSSFFNYAFKKMYFDNSVSAVDGVYRTLYKKFRLDGADNKTLLRKTFYVKSEYDRASAVRREAEKRGVSWVAYFRGYHNVTFDVNMFRFLHGYFWKYVKKYQIETTVGSQSFKKALMLLNDSVDARNILKRKGDLEYKRNIMRLVYYAEQSRKMDLKELVEKGFMARSTYYAVLKDFKRVGLSSYNPDMNLTKPALDYQEYKLYFGNLIFSKPH